jgi:hypothetical protein
MHVQSIVNSQAFPPIMNFNLAVFCGYTLYDIGLLFIERPHWSMWVHHILGLCGGVSMLLVYRDLSFSTAFFTITEWTAFTTNAVWYAQRLYSSPVLIFYLGVFRFVLVFRLI